jgi:hypothetical protein
MSDGGYLDLLLVLVAIIDFLSQVIEKYDA